MTKISEPVVFFGSGPVAAASLALLAESFDIEAVVTKPRAPHHTGDVPVIALAEKLGIPLHTASNKRELDMLIFKQSFKAKLAILIDFGIIVSQPVIDYFPYGIINSHFSLLPEWRGADPITFSILSGQPQTGVSLMLLTAGMDEGPLMAQAVQPLSGAITTPDLTQSLIDLSYALLCNIVPLYLKGDIVVADQSAVSLAATTEPTYSRKLTKMDGVLDFTAPAETLERQIRAFIEWPKSRARLHNLELVITKSHVAKVSGISGTTAIIDKEPAIYCGQDALILDSVKPVGKKEMTGKSFLAGYKELFLQQSN